MPPPTAQCVAELQPLEALQALRILPVETRTWLAHVQLAQRRTRKWNPLPLFRLRIPLRHAHTEGA